MGPRSIDELQQAKSQRFKGDDRYCKFRDFNIPLRSNRKLEASRLNHFVEAML